MLYFVDVFYIIYYTVCLLDMYTQYLRAKIMVRSTSLNCVCVSSEHTKEEGVLNTSRLIKIYVDKYDIVLLFYIQYSVWDFK